MHWKKKTWPQAGTASIQFWTLRKFWTLPYRERQQNADQKWKPIFLLDRFKFSKIRPLQCLIFDLINDMIGLDGSGFPNSKANKTVYFLLTIQWHCTFRSHLIALGWDDSCFFLGCYLSMLAVCSLFFTFYCVLPFLISFFLQQSRFTMMGWPS